MTDSGPGAVLAGSAFGGAGLDPLGAGPEEAGGSISREAWRRLRGNRVAILGAVLVLLFVLVALLAPLLAPYDPKDPVLRSQITPGNYPGLSAQHWLGVDRQGRDELSRIIYGSRQSLLVGVVATSLGFAGGMLLGLLAGAFGGWIDSLVMRVVDVLLALPGLLLAITIAAVLGQSLTSIMLAIAVVQIPIFARLLRGSMLAQRESDYVLAARMVGVRRRKIMLGHVLPNSLSPVIVQATLSLATAIIDAAALSYLGLSGTDPDVPEWGRMLAEAQQDLVAAPRLAFIPCIAIVIAALGFTLLGESLREALDPKFRR
ncbi:MAG: peptide/nickel transport system permease protein [Mycobacteriales bacterium]|jgi:ABC-type dipeptide/oligopeptide/nickel transport system permease subunit